MIEHLSEKLANSIKQANPEQTASVEKMKYALINLFHFLEILIFCLIIGALTRNPKETVIVMFAFMLIRSFSGGYHMKTLTGCAVVSTLLFSSIPFFSTLIDEKYVIIANIANVLLYLLFSPSNQEENNIPERLNPLLKTISIMIIATNFYFHSALLALTFLAQGLLLIPTRR